MRYPRCCGEAVHEGSPLIGWRESSRSPCVRSRETSMRWRTVVRSYGRDQARVAATDWLAAHLCHLSACRRRRLWRSWRPCPLLLMPPMLIWQQPVFRKSWTFLTLEPGQEPTNSPTGCGSMRYLPPRARSSRHWRRQWRSNEYSVFATHPEQGLPPPVTLSQYCSLPRTASGISLDGANCASRFDGLPSLVSSRPLSLGWPAVATPSARSEILRLTPSRYTVVVIEQLTHEPLAPAFDNPLGVTKQ